MDEKPALRMEVERTRDRVFQLRLLLEQAKGIDAVHEQAVQLRLTAEIKHLNSLVAVRSRRKRR